MNRKLIWTNPENSIGVYGYDKGYVEITGGDDNGELGLMPDEAADLAVKLSTFTFQFEKSKRQYIPGLDSPLV